MKKYNGESRKGIWYYLRDSQPQADIIAVRLGCSSDLDTVAIELLGRGLSCPEIGRLLDKDGCTILTRFTKMGIPRGPRGGRRETSPLYLELKGAIEMAKIVDECGL
jgi:hypothetical protein